MPKDEPVCIIDFCGSYHSKKYGHVYPFSYSADWLPNESLVYFTGAWSGIEPMPAMTEPTEEQVERWANARRDFELVLDQLYKGE